MSTRTEFNHNGDGYDVVFNDEFSKKLVDAYRDKFADRSDADFILVVDEQEIPCHQELLAYHSPVFKAMLKVDLVEAQNSRMNIYNMSRSVLETLLEYMYTAKFFVSGQNMMELIIASDYLQMQFLHQKLVYHTSSKDSGVFLTDKLFKWRETAERLDLPEVAMEVKKMIVAKYFNLRLMDCFLELDFIEIGRLVKEVSGDRVSKDFQVDAVLHWMHHHTNDDPLDWLSDDDLRDFMALVVDQWVVAPKETEVLKAREYNTLSDREGSWLHNSMMIYKRLQMSALEEMEDLVEKARIKAELAEIRAEQLRKRPPRIVPKHPSSHVYETFKKLYMKHIKASNPQTSDPQPERDPKTSDPQPTGDDDAIDYDEDEMDDMEEVIEAAYETFAGNKRMRQTVGIELMKLIEVVKCSMPFLNELVKVQRGGTSTSFPFTKHIIEAPAVFKKLFAEAADEAEDKGIWLPHPPTFPLRLVIVGGRMKPDPRDWNDYREVYISYDCKTIQKLTEVPSKVHPMYTSYCEVPHGYMLTGGIRSKHCCVYDTMGRQLILYCPIPVRKDQHTMAFANNRAYIVGGCYIGEWQPMVEYYDHNDRRWHHGPDTPEGFVNPHATGMGQDLYVMHSYSRLSHLDEVGFQWDERAPLPGTAPDARIANDGKRIYVAGGGERKLFAYTPDTDSWEVLSPPLNEHVHGALCYHNDRLYLLGGVGSKDIEEYNVEKDEWTMSEMELPHVLNHHYALRTEAEVPREDEVTKDGYAFRHWNWRDEDQARWKKDEDEIQKKRKEAIQRKRAARKKQEDEGMKEQEGGGMKEQEGGAMKEQDQGSDQPMEPEVCSKDTTDEAAAATETDQDTTTM